MRTLLSDSGMMSFAEAVPTLAPTGHNQGDHKSKA
jgi:hypothetical protein